MKKLSDYSLSTDEFVPMSEVVLSVLLSTFKFEMSSKEIFWNFAGVQYPTTGTKSNKAEMFLRVSLHKSI